jgi:hypothetical protein
MKNSGARSSVVLGLGAAALMLISIACGSTNNTGAGGAGGEATGPSGSAGATGAAGKATAGTSGSAGATGAAGKMVLLDDTFDTTGATGGFQIQNYVDPANLGSMAADAGTPDGGTYPTVSQADNQGQGTPPSGALKVTATYTNFNQYVEVRLGFSPAKDMTGAVLHAAVNVVPPSGATSFLGGAFIYAKSGQAYVYSNSTGTGLSTGVFTPLTFDFDTATGANGGTFMPSMIEEIGIHIYSDSPFDGGAFSSGEYTFYIDNVIATK